MSWKSRLEKSMLAGVAAGAALTWFEATHRHAALTGAARPAARAHGHVHGPSVNTVLLSGFVATTVIVGLAVFVIATIVATRWRRRSLQRARRDYGGYGGGYGGYGGGW